VNFGKTVAGIWGAFSLSVALFLPPVLISYAPSRPEDRAFTKGEMWGMQRTDLDGAGSPTGAAPHLPAPVVPQSGCGYLGEPPTIRIVVDYRDGRA
jgi:hypothetical protein